MSNKKINIFSKTINKIIIEEKLEKIIEMTYSYKQIDNNLFYNITLFEDFAWMSYYSDLEIDFNLLKNNLESKLNINISKIKNLIIELKEEPLDVKWRIIYKSLIYTEKILNVVLLWIEFELEKAGYNIQISIQEQKDRISKIEEIEEINFWLKIKNNLSEIKLIYNFLFSLFVETKSRISKKEQLFFMNYINKLNNFLDKSDLSIEKIKNQKDQFCFWSENVSRENYIKIFNYILENIYELEQRTIITDASSIYDWEKFLEIPSKDTHMYLTYKRVLWLIVHEIESHYINSYNNKLLLWSFRWARNLEKEEWLAKSMEAFLFWDNEKHAIFVPTYMAKILFSELYDWDDFYKFIDIYNKMHTLRRKPINEFLRQKRNYSLSLKWWQHKDISYWRWMIKTLEYLKKWWDFSLLFMWKVWFEDLDRIWSLYEENKSKLLFPIFIWDIIALHLQFKEQWKKLELGLEKIVKYLEKKYHFKWIERFELKKNIWERMNKIRDLLEFIDNLEK